MAVVKIANGVMHIHSIWYTTQKRKGANLNNAFVTLSDLIWCNNIWSKIELCVIHYRLGWHGLLFVHGTDASILNSVLCQTIWNRRQRRWGWGKEIRCPIILVWTQNPKTVVYVTHLRVCTSQMLDKRGSKCEITTEAWNGAHPLEVPYLAGQRSWDRGLCPAGGLIWCKHLLELVVPGVRSLN